MNCDKCGNKIKIIKNFCPHCGKPIKTDALVIEEPQKNEKKKCPSCKELVKADAKFCNFCGRSFGTGKTSVENENKSVDVDNHYITWKVLPGQLAARIDEKDISGYGTVKGLYITPGTTALIFINGRYVERLESGKYHFREINKDEAKTKGEPEDNKRSRVMTFLRNLARNIENGIQTLFRKISGAGERHYTVILVRDTHFPLLFTVENVQTRDLRCAVGLHIRCAITDINAFFNAHLIDKKSLSFAELAEQLQPTVKATLGYTLSSVQDKEINNNPELAERVRVALEGCIMNILSYCTVKNIISLTITHEGLEKIQAMQEQLYISEKELEQIQLRADFLNKMQGLEYSNELRSARAEADYLALMEKIDEDKLLNDDKKAQFVLMLSAQRQIREATTQAEISNAFDKLEQSNLLSKEEVDSVRRDIEHREEMVLISYEHDVTMAEIDNEQKAAAARLKARQDLSMSNLIHEINLDKEKLNWELQIDNVRRDNELDRRRREQEFEYWKQDENYNRELRERSDKIDSLERMQAMREKRAQADHIREQEIKELDHRHIMEEKKQDHLHDENTAKIYAGMTPEQIMASNSNLSPEAANALAAKYQAEADKSKNAYLDQLQEAQARHVQDMKDFTEGMMGLANNVITGKVDAAHKAVDDKQAELDRVHNDSEHHQDRLLSAIDTTVKIFSSAPVASVSTSSEASSVNTDKASDANAATSDIRYCPECGMKNSKNAQKCECCSNPLE